VSSEYNERCGQGRREVCAMRIERAHTRRVSPFGRGQQNSRATADEAPGTLPNQPTRSAGQQASRIIQHAEQQFACCRTASKTRNDDGRNEST
jgi:hypothetical protein